MYLFLLSYLQNKLQLYILNITIKYDYNFKNVGTYELNLYSPLGISFMQ